MASDAFSSRFEHIWAVSNRWLQLCDGYLEFLTLLPRRTGTEYQSQALSTTAIKVNAAQTRLDAPKKSKKINKEPRQYGKKVTRKQTASNVFTLCRQLTDSA